MTEAHQSNQSGEYPAERWQDVAPIPEAIVHRSDTPDLVGYLAVSEVVGKIEYDPNAWNRIKLTEGLPEVYKQLGFKFEGSSLTPTEVPDPETLKLKCLEEFNVELMLFDEKTVLSPEEYVRAYANSLHPVATGDTQYYRHDTDSDHLPALLFGGEKLKVYLAEIAQQALDTDDEAEIKRATNNIDEFTAGLTDALEIANVWAGTADLAGTHISNWTADDFEATLDYNAQDFADSYGLDATRVREIMDDMYAKAAEYQVGSFTLELHKDQVALAA